MFLGERLRDLLKAHGNFASMELQLKKWHLKKRGQSKQGAWVTKHYLANVAHWSKCMAQSVEVLIIGYELF